MSLWTLYIYYNETCVKKCQEQLLLEALVKKLPFLLKKLKDTPTVNFGMVGTRERRKILNFIKIRLLAAEKSTVKDSLRSTSYICKLYLYMIGIIF